MYSIMTKDESCDDLKIPHPAGFFKFKDKNMIKNNRNTAT